MAAYIPDWNEDPAWDTLILGGVQIPGVVTVDVNLPSGIDVQKPAKGKGASIADDGDPPAEITITVQLATVDHLAAFQEVIKVLRPKSKTGARDPLEIVHPLTALWEVGAVTIGPIANPSPTSGGAMVVTINAVEWAPAPSKANPTAKKPKGGDATSDQQDWGNVDELIDDLSPAKDAVP